MSDYAENVTQSAQSQEKKRVAAYCRVSTDHEDQANSFESQQMYFSRYIANRPDWELYGVYADQGITGTNTKKRKEFNRMMTDAEEGLFDLIITKEISRFARNTLDSILYTRRLKGRGIGVIFLNDNINTLDGDAELRLAIMSSIAQEESRRISQRVKWGQKRRMEQGIVFGRNMLGYDVKNGQMYINEEGAKVVRLIFHKYVNEKKGTYTIAKELEKDGNKPSGRVKKWMSTTILRILKNEKYCGDLVQKKTYTPDYLSHDKKYNKGQEKMIVIRDHHEPIIDRELFEEANRILSERGLSQAKKSKHTGRYALSGKIKCGCCGSSFAARQRARKDGSVHLSWRCLEACKNGKPNYDIEGRLVGCNAPTISNDECICIMKKVVESLEINKSTIKKQLLSLIDDIRDSGETRIITDNTDDLEKRTERLIDLYVGGGISKDEFIKAKSRLKEKVGEEIYDSIRKSKEAEKEEHYKGLFQISNWIDMLLEGPDEDDVFYREILDRMVVTEKERVDVYLKESECKRVVVSGKKMLYNRSIK